MLKGFLNVAKARLNANGEARLIMSNLAEHIGQRSPHDLQDWIGQAGLSVIEKRDTSPKHVKSSERAEPLYEARSREATSLYRSRSADER